MKLAAKSVRFAVIGLVVFFSAYPCSAATWYVRPDGGTRAQCTGRADKPYPGSGANLACAFKHPYFLFSTDQQYGEPPRWLIAGGDTVIIRNGQYGMGYKGPAPHDQWQFCPGNPYDCHMPPLPSGVSGHPTKFVGQNYGHCTSKPVLVGQYGVDRVLDLSGSSYVDVECLEITDHESCARIGNGNTCKSDYPIANYAKNGIVTSQTTHDITLSDLEIHGLSSTGILGPVAGNVIATRVRIAGNSASGWNFDDGSGAPSSGSLTLSYVTIEWNGCSEEYPLKHSLPYDHCTDDNSAGYGDGVGTASTTSPLGWHWIVDHSVIRYNTQDGLDLLHVHGTNSTVTITNSEFYGNMGNQVKQGGLQASTFRNNVVVGNCRYLSASHTDLPSGYNSQLSDFCRAGGNAFLKQMEESEKDVIENNSMAGANGAVVYFGACEKGSGACRSASVNFDDNLIIGFPDSSRQNAVNVPALDSQESTNYFAKGSRRNNLMFHTRSANPVRCGGSGSTGEICDADPRLISQDNIDSIDFRLTSQSRAKAAGVPISDITTDIAGTPRDPKSFDIGAYVYVNVDPKLRAVVARKDTR